MTEQNFDYSEWINRGEERIQALDLEIGAAKLIVSKQNELIEGFEVEKAKVLKALGQHDESSGATKVYKKKVRIRPVILQFLLEKKGEAITEETLIDYVQGEKSTATSESIRKSLRRLAKTNESVCDVLVDEVSCWIHH